MRPFLALLFLFGCGFYCSTAAISEKKMVVVITSFNNKHWYERNLSSVYGQKYDNYRVIYVEDCSTDGTYELVKAYIERNEQGWRTQLIRNKKNQGALFGLYHAIHSCDDDEIILQVDGDDWLKGDLVFSLINKAYDDPNVWLTYGQFEVWPQKGRGFCKEFPKVIVEKHLFRYAGWLTSQLRTFYAGLFKKIKLSELLYEHHFFKSAWDFAMMFPMLEMASDRWKFISDIIYVYNIGTPFNDCKVNSYHQARGARLARSRKPYARLPENFTFKESVSGLAVDLLVFSENQPDHLYVLLQTAQQFMRGLGQITVLFRAKDEALAYDYKELMSSFLTVRFEQLAYDEILSQKVNQALDSMPNNYCMLAHDGLLVQDKVDLHACIKALKKTHAYSFYLTLGKKNDQRRGLKRLQKKPPFISIDTNIYAWQFSDAEYDWRRFSSLDLALYRKEDILSLFKNFVYDSLDALLLLWCGSHFDLDEAGLCFENAKAILNET